MVADSDDEDEEELDDEAEYSGGEDLNAEFVSCSCLTTARGVEQR